VTNTCIKYIPSAMAKPNYFSARDHCISLGGSLYNIDTKEKEFLLYNIMYTSKLLRKSNLTN